MNRKGRIISAVPPWFLIIIRLFIRLTRATALLITEEQIMSESLVLSLCLCSPKCSSGAEIQNKLELEGTYSR